VTSRPLGAVLGRRASAAGRWDRVLVHVDHLGGEKGSSREGEEEFLVVIAGVGGGSTSEPNWPCSALCRSAMPCVECTSASPKLGVNW